MEEDRKRRFFAAVVMACRFVRTSIDKCCRRLQIVKNHTNTPVGKAHDETQGPFITMQSI